MSIARVLVVDDDRELRSTLGSILESQDYQVAFAETGEQALSVAAEQRPDLVILDLALPGKGGMDVCKELRTWADSPLMILSVRNDVADKIQAIELGADDYMCKPFVAGELLARVGALLRRARRGTSSDSILRVRDLEIDLARRRVVRNGEELKLRRKEFELLALLARHADRVVTTRTILSELWGPEYVDEVFTLRVQIGNLRKKIDRGRPRYIATEPGVGYRFVLE